MSFQVQYDIPYEGTFVKDVASLEEAKDWLMSHVSDFNFNWDSVSVVELKRDINVYELIAKKD